MALALFGLGLHLMVWPQALAASAFRLIPHISSGSLAAFFICVGLIRAISLFANGQWPTVGPHLRAAGSICGAAIWLQMDIALLGLIDVQGTPPSPGIPIYSTLVLAELVSTYRAAADAKSRPR